MSTATDKAPAYDRMDRSTVTLGGEVFEVLDMRPAEALATKLVDAWWGAGSMISRAMHFKELPESAQAVGMRAGAAAVAAALNPVVTIVQSLHNNTNIVDPHAIEDIRRLRSLLVKEES